MHKRASKIERIFLVSVMVAVILALTACSGGGAGSQSTPTAATTAINAPLGVAVLNVATDAKLGKYLVDGKGLTLYVFKLDTPGVSACLSTCGATWPPLMSNAAPIIASPLVTGKVAMITRPDGTQQVTYNGLPLYNFVMDIHPGDTSGNGYGGNWTVATP